MKFYRIVVTLPSVVAVALGLFPTKSIAQIVPDSSLPVNSIVAPNGNIFTIDGGTAAGGNLFHSFQDFSIPTGSEAFFNNALSIDNIITRVTGRNLSNIDGLIRANGAANLFLLNPNGIVFGPNAKLDIGGSFLGSTADSVIFQDGSVFSATQANVPPLLTINVPVGLQMGQNPGAIEVRGTGHTLTPDQNFNFTEFDRSNSPVGLQVETGNTLALIGGDVTLDGGILTAEAGHLEVGSVRQGGVTVNSAEEGWSFGYENAPQLGNIQLVRQSALDASSPENIDEFSPLNGGGSIGLQGDRILLEDFFILIQNQGTQPSGNIIVNASDAIEMRQVTAGSSGGSRLLNSTLGEGNSGEISVSARSLTLNDGVIISTITSGTGTSGNIEIETADSIELSGTAFNVGNGFQSRTQGMGNAGNVAVTTGQLVIRDASAISAVTLGTGLGGEIAVNAESIEVSGAIPQTGSISLIGAVTLGDGNAGSVTVNTSRLAVGGGGRINAVTLAEGSAGNLIVNASESIEVDGVGSENPPLPSAIDASGTLAAEITRQIFGLPPSPTGASGNLTINTPQLSVTDGGRVSVEHEGTGNAGDMEVNADSIFLDNGGKITASTVSGEGGSLGLNVRDLQLRGGSQITAEAGGTGNGGNIAIDSETIALLENSRITANATEGMGGNIQISTQGLFASGDSRITASSQFGVDGVVTITNPEVDPSSSLVNFSQEVVDPKEQVVSGCQWTGDSEFVATGRGGIPANPNRPMSSSRTWSDVRDLSEFRGEMVATTPEPSKVSTPLVEANTWVRHADGTIELVARSNAQSPSWGSSTHCNPRENN